MREFIRTFTLLSIALILSGVVAQSAHAHIIERIEVVPAGDEAEIQIIFDTRIQYLRKASLGDGEVHIYFNLLEPDPSATQPVSEAKESPPSDISPHFTVSYPELDSALDIKFDRQIKYRVRPGNDGRSISVFVPALKPISEPVTGLAPSALRTPEEIDLEARQLIDSARNAMLQGKAEAAIETLNRLLNLPPNPQSQTAQELIGEAREKNGEYAKAKVEYELYLQLYPDASDAKLVQQRLANLPAEAVSPAFTPRKKAVEEGMLIYGGFSQNYYRGVLNTDTSTTFNGQTTQSSWSGADQSMLISSLDVTGRKRTESTDTRFVVQDDYTANFLQGKQNDNRLGAAYVEQNSRDHGYLFRLGRQAGTSGGVLGRFDGAWLGYEFNQTWRVNAVAGTPVDYYSSSADRKTFAGLSADLTSLPGQWGGSTYLIQQRTGGVTDRQAVGLEARYFDTQHNYISLLDYDTTFKAVNIAMFQGNWTMPSGGNYNLLLDHRKSPTLQISNAIPGLTTQSISAALAQPGVTTSSLRDAADALTPTTNLFLIGTTQPYSAHWRFGGDFRISNISGTGASGTQVATPGTGNTYIYSAQAIGNSLLAENDLGIISASYINAHSYTGQSLAFNQFELFQQHWRLDVLLQLYRQSGTTGDSSYRQTRITPGMKLGYRFNDSVSMESEAGMENNRTSSSISNNTSRRKYFYIGYRWDFR